MADPQRGVQYTFVIALTDSGGAFLTDPTLAAGDFRVSIDGAAYANLMNTPVVSPSGSPAVFVTLTATEMDGDNIIVWGVDQAGAEWSDVFVAIETSSIWTQELDDSYTAQDMMVLMAAALAGELSGAPGTSIDIRNISDTKTVITATVDSNGNRTATTLDP